MCEKKFESVNKVLFIFFLYQIHQKELGMLQ